MYHYLTKVEQLFYFWSLQRKQNTGWGAGRGPSVWGRLSHLLARPGLLAAGRGIANVIQPGRDTEGCPLHRGRDGPLSPNPPSAWGMLSPGQQPPDPLPISSPRQFSPDPVGLLGCPLWGLGPRRPRSHGGPRRWGLGGDLLHGHPSSTGNTSPLINAGVLGWVFHSPNPSAAAAAASQLAVRPGLPGPAGGLRTCCTNCTHGLGPAGANTAPKQGSGGMGGFEEPVGARGPRQQLCPPWAGRTLLSHCPTGVRAAWPTVWGPTPFSCCDEATSFINTFPWRRKK